MIRPTGTNAIRRRHSPWDRCCRDEPLEYMRYRMPWMPWPAQGTRSLLPGTSAVALVLLVEHPDRVGGGLGAALHSQLGEQGRHVVLHRLLGQEHPLADLPVGQPLADQLQDLALLGGQAGQR